MKIYRISALTGDQEAEKQYSSFLEDSMKRDISIIFVKNLHGAAFGQVSKVNVDAKYDKQESLVNLFASAHIKQPFIGKSTLETKLIATQNKIKEKTSHGKVFDKNEIQSIQTFNRLKTEIELALKIVDNPQKLLSKIQQEIEEKYNVPAQVAIFDVNNRRFGE